MPSYLKFYFSALTKYQVHSPFVYEFMMDIFEDNRFYHFFGVIENYRQNLLRMQEKLGLNGAEKTINQLVKTDSINQKTGEILFKTIHHYKPDTLLELGTNFGIATLYQATPNPQVPIISIEENEQIAIKTSTFFEQLGTRNIQQIKGNIAKNLPKALHQLKSVEHIFFNGFWGKNTTFNYFNTCCPYFVTNSVFIFRAPYTSSASLAFWEELKKQEMVKLSIDLYDLGFLFFRSEQKEVAHYKLIESWKKPWAFM